MFKLSMFCLLVSMSFLAIYNVQNAEATTFDDNEIITEYINNYDQVDVTRTNKIIDNHEIDYLMVLEIKKINLRKGIYDKFDDRNNIDKNLYLLPESTMPTAKSSNIIIGAHSGTGKLAFFKDLYKLSVDDTISIYFSNRKYVYQIKSIYEDNKDGNIIIRRNTDKDTITLFTCNPLNKGNYIVFIGELIDKL